MIDNPAQSPCRRPSCAFSGVLCEAAMVVLVGVALGFLANRISPAGLELGRDPFPAESVLPSPLPAHVAGATNTPSRTDLLRARLEKEGLHLMDLAEAGKAFHDPRVQQNLILFVDARDEDLYREGHIPGAMEFFPYHPEKYLTGVLPACQVAEKIVVYCAGGECEDSQSAAIDLHNYGIPADRIYVFGDGITGWKVAGMPIETGDRNSGNIQGGAK